MHPLLRLRSYWLTLSSSLWFVPGACVITGIVLAIVLTVVDLEMGSDWISDKSRIFGVGADGARGMLAAIAGSMMTVASLTFSLTISTLATASSQYSSRLIRNFMRDRVNQFVLGFFVGLFAYCLVVLRSIRGGDEGQFVPSISVLVGLVLALISVGVLVFFIHHIAESIQASVILDRVTDETIDALRKIFPKEIAEAASESSTDLPELAKDPDAKWHRITAGEVGYVQQVDADALLAIAQDNDTVVRMEADIGAFVTEKGPLCSLRRDHPADEDLIEKLRDAFSIGAARTIEQDPSFGIRQIVDIALKALSPGINDTTTAVMCIEHLASILETIGSLEIPDRMRAKDDVLRLVARGRTFESLVRACLDQTRHAGTNNVAVSVTLLKAIVTAAEQTCSPQRRELLRHQAKLVAEVAADSLDYDYDRDTVRDALSLAIEATGDRDPTLPRLLLPPAALQGNE